MGPMERMILTSPIGPISPISETHRILILGPPGVDHQLQKVLRALRTMTSLISTMTTFVDPLAEIAPHRLSLIAVTMEEGATRSGLTPNARFKWRVMIYPPIVETMI